MVAIVLSLPWLLAFAAFFVVVRAPRELPRGMAGGRLPGAPPGAPLVSVVIPARNEAHNIERVLASVCASVDVRFEVIVVDDRSEDGTGSLARGMACGRAERRVVIEGEPLPEGWFGKPWACRQGAAEARGELLLFTDADTVHAPDLLARSLAALEEDRAHAVTVLGRQIMGSLWERLVQPQIFAMLLTRFRDPRRPLPSARWRDAIANGQYLLFRRDVYDAVGGHGAVRHEVAEDLRLAQILVKGGWTLSFRGGEDALGTRMYRSLGELVDGWSKNASVGARQTVPGWARPLVLPAAITFWSAMWLAPPLALLLGMASRALGAGPAASAPLLGTSTWALPAGTAAAAALLIPWGAVVVGASVLFWGVLGARMGTRAAYGLLYPLGAAVAVWILVRSAWRGGRVAWKGREYRVG